MGHQPDARFVCTPPRHQIHTGTPQKRQLQHQVAGGKRAYRAQQNEVGDRYGSGKEMLAA
jgi:hypothetical protein